MLCPVSCITATVCCVQRLRYVSCIPPNISHPPCCKLAQVVALSSPPFNVKLSVWLPSSCNAAPLIAKATTQLKEVAFCQPITQYHIQYCAVIGWADRICWMNSRWGNKFKWLGKVWRICQPYRLTFRMIELWDSAAHFKCKSWREMYRVIHKSLRDFRTRLRNNQDRHGRKEHINR